jgi:hypothetical protein
LLSLTLFIRTLARNKNISNFFENSCGLAFTLRKLKFVNIVSVVDWDLSLVSEQGYNGVQQREDRSFGSWTWWSSRWNAATGVRRNR